MATMKPFRVLLAAASIFPLWTGSLFTVAAPPAGGGPSGAVPEIPVARLATDFVQFVEDDKGARLQTAVASYRNARGVVVDLVGAVHVGDEAYYKGLNERFKNYEVVLYEMVGGPIEKREQRQAAIETQTRPEPGVPGATRKPDSPASKADAKATPSSGSVQELAKDYDAETEAAAAGRLSWLNGLHTTLQSVLQLHGQLDVVDYHARNFVHADMSLAQFADLQNQRKEGFMALWLKAVQVQMSQPQTQANQPGLLKLMEIICRADSATELKRLIGRTFDSVETLIAGLEAGEGTVIISERNKVALNILRREINMGQRRIAVFYGAAHLPDMEKRLIDMGFQFEKSEWVTAWDLPPEPPQPTPAAPPVPSAPQAVPAAPLPSGRQNP